MITYSFCDQFYSMLKFDILWKISAHPLLRFDILVVFPSRWVLIQWCTHTGKVMLKYIWLIKGKMKCFRSSTNTGYSSRNSNIVGSHFSMILQTALQWETFISWRTSHTWPSGVIYEASMWILGNWTVARFLCKLLIWSWHIDGLVQERCNSRASIHQEDAILSV